MFSLQNKFCFPLSYDSFRCGHDEPETRLRIGVKNCLATVQKIEGTIIIANRR